MEIECILHTVYLFYPQLVLYQINEHNSLKLLNIFPGPCIFMQKTVILNTSI
jgi:hypothetical protein